MFSEIWKNTFFTGVRLQFQEYVHLQIIWNSIFEHPGIYLSSIARHVCCGSFMLFSIVANTGCMHKKLKDDSTIAITMVIGAIVFAAGFICTFQEARITQKNVIASSSTILRFKAEANSRFTCLKAKSILRFRCELGWILYRFDGHQFLEFLQFILDKVILFTLMICEK